MAIRGTPLVGLAEIARRVYVAGDTLTVIAYRNPANSLGPGSLQSDLLQPALSGGYSPIPLDGQWSVVNGLATYVHSNGADPIWTVTNSWGATIIGVAIVYGSTLMHFKDLVTPFDATVLNARLAVNVSSLVSTP